MKFYDKVKITCVSGKGGDGAVAARREAGVPYGGPAGGNGGKGGDIVFVADENVTTLIDYRNHRKLTADKGQPGQHKDQYGRGAEDSEFLVPIGTIIKNAKTGNVLHQFRIHEEKRVAVQGGHGGVGNMHFANSVRQYPNFALLGEPGEVRELELELQLLGDVGLVGTPSVGKSTIINSISNVKAKVADYPFTTLIPNLGSVKVDDFSFNVVDIPGLIEGAHEGKGLGNAFLRHVLKAKIFAFVLDISRYDTGMLELPLLMDEIKAYIDTRYDGSTEYGAILYNVTHILKENDGHILYEITGEINGEIVPLLRKKILFLVNKIDLVNDADIQDEYIKTLYDIFSQYTKKTFNVKISEDAFFRSLFLVAGYNTATTHLFINHVADTMRNQPLLTEATYEFIEFEPKFEEYVTEITEQEMPVLIDLSFIAPEHDTVRIFEVYNKEIARLVFTLPRGNDEAELWFWNVCKKSQFLNKMKKYGFGKGDIMKVISPYEGIDNKYVRYSLDDEDLFSPKN